MQRSTIIKKSSKRSQRNLQQEVLPSSPKKPKPTRTSTFQDVSDFESEDDEVPVKILFSNRAKMAVVKPRNDDLFDALKRSTN